MAYIKNGAFLFVSLGLMIWALSTTQWVISIFALLAMIYSVSSMYSLKNKSHLSAASFDIERIKNRLEAIKGSLKEYTGGHHQVEFYNQQLQLRDEWKIAYTQVNQQQQRLETLHEQKKEYQQLYQDHLEKLRDVKSNLGLSEKFTISRLDDAYDLLVDLLKLTKLKDRKKNELQQHLNHEEQWINQLREISLSDQFNENEVDEYFYKVRDVVRVEKEKNVTKKELLNKLADLQPEATSLKIELEQYNQSIDELLQLAGVHHEEEFRVKAEKYEKATTTKDKNQYD